LAAAAVAVAVVAVVVLSTVVKRMPKANEKAHHHEKCLFCGEP